MEYTRGRAVTASLTLDYVAPARGDVVRADAVVVYHSGRRSIGRCKVLTRHGGGWTPCVLAQGVVVRIAAQTVS